MAERAAEDASRRASVIPFGAPRGRKRRRREPDAAALAHLRVIEREPEAVERALAWPPAA